MVGMIANFLTNPGLANIAQSTTSAVTLETTMKAVGRPSFILADKKLDKQTKHYAATKEFLYQITCLGVYMALVIPVFKNGAFALAKKCFKDEKAAFGLFKNAKEYLTYQKLAKMSKADRITEIDKHAKRYRKLSENLKNILKTQDKPEKHSIVKGAIELGNIVGCVVGLAIVSPQVSHMVVHPAMELLGFKKPEQNIKASEHNNLPDENNLDLDA
ncbi:hypothetical protein J6S88_07885 [bacterium]|nr:hypothetical protein [bacterium]